MIGLVEYRPSLNFPPEHGDLYIGPIRLTEGMNEIDIDTWIEFAQNNPIIKARIVKGIIRETFTSSSVNTINNPPSKSSKKELKVTFPVETKLATGKTEKEDENSLPLPVIADKK